MTADLPAEEVIERTWSAPIEAVWTLWTTPAGIEAWYGPEGFTATVEAHNFVQGGTFNWRMTATSPQMVAWMQSKGRPLSWPNPGTFTEIVHHKRIVFQTEVPGESTSMMVHTVTLTPTDAGVHMRLAIRAVSADMLRGAAMGWRSSMDRLDKALQG